MQLSKMTEQKLEEDFCKMQGVDPYPELTIKSVLLLLFKGKGIITETEKMERSTTTLRLMENS